MSTTSVNISCLHAVTCLVFKTAGWLCVWTILFILLHCNYSCEKSLECTSKDRWTVSCWEDDPLDIPRGMHTFELQFWSSFTATHRYHLLFLALLGQVLDAVDEELVGADVGPASLDHPAAQLHQLARGGEKHKNHHFKRPTGTGLFKESHASHSVMREY